MKQKLEGLNGFDTLSADRDGLGLLKAIKGVTYMENIQNIVDVIEHRCGSIGIKPGIADALANTKIMDLNTMTSVEKAIIGQEAHRECTWPLPSSSTPIGTGSMGSSSRIWRTTISMERTTT
eukprot:scaffold13054_cov70-Attheya_sp.AAC.4